ncbi:hypothetical protein D8674_022301 [Pyrus ussuriensis x Pyrus communis]|uniref:TMV resistance protein N-like n=1 Tax=Pyrus ussuriensis x Pyrus communis TaxID=2448454 RepID=A0A5N5GLM1_9ROSA|nr:hypothetical protein D8674_022301 [Pyrus ussuriensis x Pyrus communis]
MIREKIKIRKIDYLPARTRVDLKCGALVLRRYPCSRTTSSIRRNLLVASSKGTWLGASRVTERAMNMGWKSTTPTSVEMEASAEMQQNDKEVITKILEELKASKAEGTCQTEPSSSPAQPMHLSSPRARPLEPIVSKIPVVSKATSPKLSHVFHQASQLTSSKITATTYPSSKAQSPY